MELIKKLEIRFNKHMHRHPNTNWSEVSDKISKSKDIINLLNWMEETGGEPDLVVFNNNEIYYIDCSKESPQRRSLCYDNDALKSRTKFPPKDSALNLISQLNVSMLSENDYINLQKIEDFDLKTSSWILTNEEIRSLGGALFGDKRYNRTFIYHNGADSYYSNRGFRVKIFI